MTLVFFGPPALLWCLLLIVPTYYLLSRYGRQRSVPAVAGAAGIALLLYPASRGNVPAGASSGYE